MAECYLARRFQMAIRKVSSNGRIVLGKQYAGRYVWIDEMEPGVWIVKTSEFIPDNERWLHTPEVEARLKESFAWAAENPPQETDLDELEKRMLGDS
jgi:hypothetical protein